MVARGLAVQAAMQHALRSTLIGCLLVALAGCSARHKASMALAEAQLVAPDPSPQPLVADPSAATLVFIRPGSWAGQVVYFDERGALRLNVDGSPARRANGGHE
jgi:hypothetical protein